MWFKVPHFLIFEKKIRRNFAGIGFSLIRAQPGAIPAGEEFPLSLVPHARVCASPFSLHHLVPCRDAFGGSLFPVALWMNAEVAPRRLREVDLIVLRRLFDVGEG
jgi:hypothetical protein